MSAQHSPGPWAVVPYGDGDSLVIHDARADFRVCFMATPGDSPNAWATIQANARLIAAAPDLLKAAQRALAVLRATNGESVRPANVLGALDAAISKATAASAPEPELGEPGGFR